MSARTSATTQTGAWTGWVATDTVVPNPEQPRVTFEPGALERLGKSLMKGQRVAASVTPHTDPQRPAVEWMLVDGERRWRAASERGLPLLVTYVPEVPGEDLHLASFTANWCREGHTKEETAKAIARQKDRGLSDGDIAEAVGKSGAWVWQHHELLKLHPDLLKKMDPPTPLGEKVSLKVALLLVHHAPGEQMELYERCVKGTKQADAFHKVRNYAPATSGRSAAEDWRYVEGQLVRGYGILAHVATGVSEVLLKRLSATQLSEAQGHLEDCERALGKARERIAALLAMKNGVE